MISLRRVMREQAEEAFESAVDSYRDALGAIGDAAARACPPAGETLRRSLQALREELTREAPPNVLSATEKRLETELRTWGEQAAQFYQDHTNEVKTILSIVGDAAREVGERDQRYAKKFGDLKDRLKAANQLTDLTAIRQSLGKSVTDLSACVTSMTKDSQDSIAQLRAQLSTYETRLEEVENIAFLDPLTGIGNRRKIELQLERRINESRNTSLIYLDLNAFKQINDAFGHLAGDDLLKQFAGELRTVIRSSDIVGRWGGDEFIILVDGDAAQANRLSERIEQWVGGEYVLSGANGQERVKITAAIGVASWKFGDTPTDLLSRADSSMYERKSCMKSHVSR